MNCKTFSHIFSLSSLVLLAACGDDSSSNSGEESLDKKEIPVFESADKLGDCGAENEFETVYVKADSSFYVCDEGKWTNGFNYANLAIDIDTLKTKEELGECSAENEGEMHAIPHDSKGSIYDTYACEGGEWISDFGGSDGTVSPSTAVKGTFTDERDGKKYKTVKIGKQTWMAENLSFNYNHNSAKSYCYDNDETNCATYGRLYTWAAAMDSAGIFSEKGKGCGGYKTCGSSGVLQGVCPEGWHLPGEAEWRALFSSVGFDSNMSRVKSQTGWWSGSEVYVNKECSNCESFKLDYDWNGSDDYGFSVLPAGRYSVFREFSDRGKSTYFWTSTEESNDYAYRVFLKTYVSIGGDTKVAGYSVRCVMD